jgi:hypothetical protein
MVENLDKIIDRMREVIRANPKIIAGELRELDPDFKQAIDWLRANIK